MRNLTSFCYIVCAGICLFLIGCSNCDNCGNCGNCELDGCCNETCCAEVCCDCKRN
jgi:hypothetical protein